MRRFGRFTEVEVVERLTSLPTWAQKFIEHLQREKAGLERQVESFNEDQTPSDISWQQMLESEHWVPKHSHVRFYIDPDTTVSRAHVDVFFRNEGERKVLEIQGSRSYNIEPRAGNSVYIIMQSREEYYGTRKKTDKEVS